ncbi:MAG: fumarylacetoacetate hydrolase family protein [Spirochaetes bacterium]|jgi:2-keto-4-pentenoate hydratase/2-oxohepta-3-ene-1,7-dioic acid hydratase in catechol pathway|nr:fumarylacetoacetate hydrolase family protein [Spirochaetota bacterium]
MNPSKIVCVGLNYRKHATELGMPLPSEPIIFMKPPSSIIRNGDGIVYPNSVERVDYEAELGVIISRNCKNIEISEALEYVYGYCCVNDVTARDVQSREIQWTRAKSFDTFCPVGQIVIKEEITPDNLRICSYLNDEIKQNSNTSDMIFSVSQCISFISKTMTLLPGDLISTGTPEGIGPMKRGDSVRVEIEGFPVLMNSVK